MSLLERDIDFNFLIIILKITQADIATDCEMVLQ
ncbi:Uncharacterised protein [Legionella wadsworthii]|uniref:Uncharacterized protein n=1 Tax=Legionella wadsworthii TaxID=28088 RepID=A0A378LSW0_9GAMM|nr:Uncharacterised protein [Legionella wadsworthii]